MLISSIITLTLLGCATSRPVGDVPRPENLEGWLLNEHGKVMELKVENDEGKRGVARCMLVEDIDKLYDYIYLLEVGR